MIHQPSYNLFNRWIEETGLLDLLKTAGVGCIAYSPLAQGILAGRYLQGIPDDSRATKAHSWLKREQVTAGRILAATALQEIARKRGQTLPQMALAWTLRRPEMTSALIGASSPAQIEENVAAIRNTDFAVEELQAIDAICARAGG